MMNENIISAVSSALSITSGAVKATLALLEDGATIPFIARYRKEATGSLDEVAIENISRKAEEFKALYKRKEYVLEVIGATGGLTDELKQRIASTMDASDLEDIFAPYKPKRQTKAAVAREKGLCPGKNGNVKRRGGYIGDRGYRPGGADVSGSKKDSLS